MEIQNINLADSFKILELTENLESPRNFHKILKAVQRVVNPKNSWGATLRYLCLLVGFQPI